AARADEIREVTVVERPAVAERHGGEGIDAIVTVVAVEPRATTDEHVAAAAGGIWMTAEAVGVAERTAVEAAIVIRIAVQHEIAGTGREIPAVAHAVVHRELFEAIPAAAGDAEAFRLRVRAGDDDLYADDIKTFEHAIAPRDEKRRHAPAGGLDGG